MKRQMRLGLSVGNVGYHYGAWRHPDVPANGDMSFRHYLKCAQIAERGKLDFLFFADVAAVRNLDDPRIARHREQGQVKHEPTLLVSALAAATKHIGFLPTCSTSYHHPYNLGRRLASIDHISKGRLGWNLVTSTNADEARNFGQDKAADSDTRHARAREFAEVMHGLWDSWDDDAFLRDKESGVYFHRDKFHYLNHDGAHFKVRGPLDTARPPQGRLPIITAGASENAQELAAELADMVYAAQPNLDVARRYHDSVKGRLARYGRSAASLKVMVGIMPVIGRTQAEAQARFDELQALLDPSVSIGMMIINQFPDLTGYPLDEPVPSLNFARNTTAASRNPVFTLQLMEKARAEGMTLRQLFAAVSAGFWHLGVIGTPGRVADIMEEWFTGGAADGFIIQPPYLPGGAEDFIELVLPELQRRGLFRHDYEGRTLRENLGLPRPASRYQREIA